MRVINIMAPVNTARDLEIKTSIQRLIREWFELKLDRINFPFIHGHTPIQTFDKVFDDEELMMLSESCLDFTLVNGRFSRQFESQLANLFGVKSVISSISEQMTIDNIFQILGSPALNLKALTPGDEIITCPSLPYKILEHRDFIPVYVDIDPETFNIDEKSIQKAISSRTKAIFVSHFAGNPSNMSKISEIAKEHDLWLIECCFDAIGSKFENKYVGTFADISFLKFSLNQQITTAEGGALLINNDVLSQIQISNIRMTEMQASIGIAQLRKLPYFIDARKRNFNMLNKSLKSFESVFKIPEKLDKSEPCWAFFPVVIKEDAGFIKDDLIKYLDKYNILTAPIIQDMDNRIKDHSGMDHFKHISENGFKIGIYPTISDEVIKYIISKINEFIVNHG